MILTKWYNFLKIRQKVSLLFTIVLLIIYGVSAIVWQITTSKRVINEAEIYTTNQLITFNNLVNLAYSENSLNQAESNKLKNVKSYFDNQLFFENSLPYLVDLKGNILIHPYNTQYNLSEEAFFVKIISLGNQGNFKMKIENENDKIELNHIYFIYNKNSDAYIVTQFTNKEIFKNINRSRVYLVLAIFIILIFTNLLIYFLITPMIKMIQDINNKVLQLSKGSIVEKINQSSNDELGEIIYSFNALIDGLSNTSEFAKQLGNGNYKSEYTPIGNDDISGKSLLEMREGLKNAQIEDKLREKEEQKRNWINEGIAKFGEILRVNNDNIEVLAYEIINNIVIYLNANQGGLFIYNDEEYDNIKLDLLASFAYNRKKFKEKEIMLGEGLIGTCAIEKKTIYLTEIPKKYIEITSGLGEANPKSLLIIPLKVEDSIYGVIEIASFGEFEDYQIDFLEKLGESIASTLSSVKVNIKTSALLEQSQQQAEEMAAQEEEMRQNMEELQATQEELERKNQTQLEDQEELSKEKILLDSLLTSIPDYIYFKDKQSKFIRISQSMVGLFKATETNELIGKSDFDFHNDEHARKAFEEEQDIIKTHVPVIDNIVNEKWEDGRDYWISTTKMALLDKEGNAVFIEKNEK